MLRRHKIDILVKDTGSDDYGEPVDTWKTFRNGVWASKEPIIGKEFYTSLTLDENIDAKFKTGYISGVNSAMRLKNGNDVYEILGQPVNINDRNMELLFYCRLVK